MELTEFQEEQLVIFKLKSEEFGVNISNVKEIIRIPEITTIPNAQAYMEGIINLRGKVIPVLNIKKIFGFGSEVNQSTEKIVIIEVNSHCLGILVDDVTEVLKISKSNIEPPPTNVMGIINNYIKGVGKIDQRLIILLDLVNLVPSNYLEEIHEVIS